MRRRTSLKKARCARRFRAKSALQHAHRVPRTTRTAHPGWDVENSHGASKRWPRQSLRWESPMMERTVGLAANRARRRTLGVKLLNTCRIAELSAGPGRAVRPSCDSERGNSASEHHQHTRDVPRNSAGSPESVMEYTHSDPSPGPGQSRVFRGGVGRRACGDAFFLSLLSSGARAVKYSRRRGVIRASARRFACAGNARNVFL